MGKFIFFLYVVFVVRTVSSQFSKNCQTPSNLDGVCLDMNLCPPLKMLFEVKHKNESVISFLRNSICGYRFKQYKVCCPLADGTFSATNSTSKPEVQIQVKDKLVLSPSSSSSESVSEETDFFIKHSKDPECKTPKNLKGICINIQRCKTLDNMFIKYNKNESISNFLSQSFCGNDGQYPKVCCPLNSNYETVSSRNLPSQKSCGLTPFTSSKIVGGQTADLGAWPWIAALGYKSIANARDKEYQWLCGGTLISDRYVVTAAHCTVGPSLITRKLEVAHLGDLDLDPSVKDEATPIDYGVIRILRHPQYNSRKFTNDIALLQLNDTVTFTNFIQPICLPTLSYLRQHSIRQYLPFVAGWGRIQFGDESSSALLQVQVPVRDNEECNEFYSSVGQLKIDNNTMLCAGEKGKDTCQGDSGGPLMLPYATRFYLLGIISFGVRCADKIPGVYTKVSAFIEWIVDTIDENK